MGTAIMKESYIETVAFTLYNNYNLHIDTYFLVSL